MPLSTKLLNDNHSYSSMAKKYSKLLQDRPLSPKDTAVYWLEYVMRHHGAPHMQYPSIHQNLLQRNSIDVIAFLILVGYILVKIIKIVFKFICRKIVRIFSKKIKKN